VSSETQTTLEDAVAEILGMLTGLDVTYDPSHDRFRSVVRQLNRALRLNSLEKEWSWYSSTTSLGPVVAGEREVFIPSSLRPRIINDDAVRLCNAEGRPLRWAYFLPRDALHKYDGRGGLWASVTRQTLSFSRPFHSGEEGLDIQLPVMREPRMFRLPELPADPNTGTPAPSEAVLNQLVDFQYPDVVVMRAAFLYAQTDPVLQPRVQTIEAQYKDLMYQVIERDERNTDSPMLNEFVLPIQGDISPGPFGGHRHPHADVRW
jgi:hypothetical protein